MRERLSPALRQLGVDWKWVTSAAAAKQACRDQRFEVALVDAGLRSPEAALAALDLRGRRLRPAVIVFSAGDQEGFARLDAEALPVEDVGGAVLALFGAGQGDGERSGG